MMMTINDPVFNEMTYDHGWEKKEWFRKNVAGDKIELRIHCQAYSSSEKTQEITEQQRLAYLKFKKDIADFGSCQIRLGAAIERYAERNNIELPLIAPNTLYISRNGGYGLLCDCNWDKEHGCAVIFTNGDDGLYNDVPASIYIGEQDELI